MPEFGYQGQAPPREVYREALKSLKDFDRLSPAEQDQKLSQIESSHFFALLRQHTIEGMFCDPIHGGNVDMVGWQLIGFPGPRMSNFSDIDKYPGEAFRPKPASLEQVPGVRSVPLRTRTVMKTLPATDVVIIGGGWTGLLMAKELGARTPLSILVLERGAPRHKEDYVAGMDELDYNVRFRMMQDYSLETATLRHTVRDRSIPIRQLGSFMPGQGTGGAGEHWGAVFPRFLPDVFELLKSTTERYGPKKLPENHSVVDWGITWDEIEPYYTRADKLVGSSGKAGNIRGKLVEGGNIFEGARSEEYPTPPTKTPHYGTMFAETAKSLGYHPYPNPAATLSTAYTNPDGISRPACFYCGFCDRFGCMVGAKAQPTTRCFLSSRNKKPLPSQRLPCAPHRV